MRRSTAGFSVVEGMVGASILVVVLLATTHVFKPIGAAAKKAKILNSMIKVENLIREGVYIQGDYSNPNSFEIKKANDIIAKHGVTTYLNDNLSLCDQGAACDLQVKIAVQDFGPAGNRQKGVIYQIASGAGSGARLLPLGVLDWPTTNNEMENYLADQNSGKFGASSTSVVIPEALVTSTYKKCENGFMRGVSNGNQVICWDLVGDKQCPSWSLPVGYRLEGATSKMWLLCQKLNRITCPQMSISLSNPVSIKSLNNFYSLNKLDKRDLYPPRATASEGVSSCRSIMDFKDQSIANNLGVISAAAVTANKGNCPDAILYQKIGDGTCVPNFNPALILETAKARILENKFTVLPANELRELPGADE